MLYSMARPPLHTVRHSLQEMSLRTVVSCIWHTEDILSRIAEFDLTLPGHDFMFVWQEYVEAKVKERISDLFLPDPVKRSLKLIVRPVGIQIVEWMLFMREHLKEMRQSYSVLKEIEWTGRGTINYEYTAVKLVCLNTLDMVKRFKLACTYCLDELLPLIWLWLPEEYKAHFCDCILETSLGYSVNIIEIYWVYVLKGEEAKLLSKQPSFFARAFHFSAINGNRVATQYFFRQLTGIQKGFMLVSTFKELLLDEATTYMSPWDFPEEKYSDVLCYLLTVLPAEYKVAFVRRYPSYILQIFLHWPWQDHLADNAELMWKILYEESHYENMLRHIRKKMLYARYYYPKVIQEIFRVSPPGFRKLFVDKECQDDGFFARFLRSDDRVTFRIILRSLVYEDRVRLFTCDDVVNTLNCMILSPYEHEPTVIEQCIQEAAFSKEDRNRLKALFLKLNSANPDERIYVDDTDKIHAWEQLFNSIDEREESLLRKRKLVFEEPTEAKKLCT